MVSNLNLLESRRRILLNTPRIETVSDTIASFKTDIATKIKGCKIHFTPIQEGEGDPSPDNVRPIHGWDGVTVYHGVNILEGLQLRFRGANSSIYSVSGEITVYTAIGEACETYIDVRNLRGKSLTLNHRPTGNSGGFAFYSETNTGSFISGIANNGVSTQEEWTITVPDGDNVNYMRFSANPNYIDNVMLVTDYSEISIPFPQTIYGGYVDLVKGEVVEEWTKRNLNAFSQTIISGGGFQVGHWLSSGWEKKNGTDNFISDVFKQVISGTVDQTMKGYCNTYPILLYDSSITTVDEFKEKYADNYIVYAIRHPITYIITPQTLKVLRGMNNIWSDANGDVEVSYYTH